MKTSLAAAVAAIAIVTAATPAFAQEEDTSPVTVSGTTALVSDYRFRGVSQSDRNMAIQGGITIAHESGPYIGAWGSNLSGWGTFGGANMELDLIAGYKASFGDATVDIGATWYMYPKGFDNTDFVEPYIKVSGTTGPVSLTAGVAYAPKQEALGAWYAANKGGLTAGQAAAAGIYTDEFDKNDNLYLWGDIASAIPDTGLTLKGHIGYSKGNDGLGPFATSVAPTGEYWDWLVGADYAIGGTPLILGVAYVDTDITDAKAAYLQPSFSRGQDGVGSIAASTVVVTLTAAF